MDRSSVIRTIVLVLSVINLLLNALGYSTIPVEEYSELLAAGIVSIVSLWTWHKNNYIFKKGKAQKDILERHRLK